MRAHQSPVKIALIGAGFISNFHLKGLSSISEATVKIIASRTLSRAVNSAERFGIVEATDDVYEVLHRPDIDAVIITTPDDTHEDLAISALNAGKAVLLQKPMATRSDSCRKIIATAKHCGLDLQVSWMHRYFPEVDAAIKLIREGAIGTPITVRLRNATPGPDWNDWFFSKDAVSGGVIHQLGVHGIDLLNYMFGPIEKLCGRMFTLQNERRLMDGRIIQVENPDTAFAIYHIKGGLKVTHEMSMIEVAGTSRFRMEIYGSAGTLWLRTERGILATIRADEKLWTEHTVLDEPFGHRLHQAWVDGLIDPAKRLSTAYEGLKSILVAEAILNSSEKLGAEIQVEQV